MQGVLKWLRTFYCTPKTMDKKHLSREIGSERVCKWVSERASGQASGSVLIHSTHSLRRSRRGWRGRHLCWMPRPLVVGRASIWTDPWSSFPWRKYQDDCPCSRWCPEWAWGCRHIIIWTVYWQEKVGNLAEGSLRWNLYWVSNNKAHQNRANQAAFWIFVWIFWLNVEDGKNFFDENFASIMGNKIALIWNDDRWKASLMDAQKVIA